VTDGDRRDGALVLVATPIGNLGDLSPRAVATMAAAALVCAEDSRRVAKLFAHAGIAKVPVVVTNEHTELSRIPTVLATLADGGDVVLVSDAGTPGVSDRVTDSCRPCSTPATPSRSFPVPSPQCRRS